MLRPWGVRSCTMPAEKEEEAKFADHSRTVEYLQFELY